MISDRYGRKPVLYIGLIIYLGGTLGCVFAGDIETLILARFIQGFGGASGPALARAMVADSYNRVEAAKVMASIAGAMALVPAIAPIFGSWLLYLFEWRSHFVLLFIFGLFAFVSVIRLQESLRKPSTVPVRLSSLFKQFPLCLKDIRFVGFTLCGGATYAAMFCYISSSSFLVIGLLGVAPEYFGYTFMVVVVGYIIGAMSSSRLVGSWGVVRVLSFGQATSVLAAILLMALAIFEVHHLSGILIAFFMVFFAGGMSLSVSQMGAIAELPNDAGKASSVFGFLEIAFASLLGYLVGLFYNDSLMPTAIGVSTAVLISASGYLIIRKTHETHTE